MCLTHYGLRQGLQNIFMKTSFINGNFAPPADRVKAADNTTILTVYRARIELPLEFHQLGVLILQDYVSEQPGLFP